jgi:Reverse transcriptase (RNA-dependent DNA polymerase)
MQQIAIFFYGTKCFFEVHWISEAEEQILPKVQLTDGARPYEPLNRLHSRRRPVLAATDSLEWKKCLGFTPDHVVDKTLRATTQLVPTVEAETREIMRDHFQTRLPQLKVRRVNDTCYVDTFFSSIPSVRGFTCWNLYCFRLTGLDVVYLMRRRAQGPTTLPKMVADCGAPSVIKSDNAPEFKGKRWVDYLDTVSIRSKFTEAHHPNENLAERRGGSLKAATVHLMTSTGCPLNYWCYALEYMSLLRTVPARRSLDWRTPHEAHWGDRPDISVFRFVFWEPIWYYHPRQAFPKPKMMKGRFLGVAQNIGDAFCFLILTQPEADEESSPQVLARSVIRRRYLREEAPIVDPIGGRSTLTFYCNDEVTPLADPSPNAIDHDTDVDPFSDIVMGSVDELRALLSSPTASGVVRSPDNFDDDVYEVFGPPSKRPRPSIDDSAVLPLDPTVLATQASDLDSEERLSSVPLDAVVPEVPLYNQVDTNSAVPLRDSPIASVLPAATAEADSPDDGPLGVTDDEPGAEGDVPQITQDEDMDDAHVSDEVTQQLSNVAEDGASDELFDRIDGHEWHDGQLMFQVRWKTDEVSMLPFSLVKRDFPSAAASYVLEHKVGNAEGRYSGGRYTRWARQYNRAFSKVVRRFIRLQGGPSDESTTLQIASHLPNGTRIIRRVVRAIPTTGGVGKRKKPGRISRPLEVKYGVPIPRSVKHAYELDKEAGNTFWADAIRKEIDSLLALDCFAFHAPDYKPSSDYQWTKLNLIFEVKQDGRRKARMVAGGHLVDPMGISSRSTVVKGISVRLLDLIAHRDNLPILCGDIGNAFITADCLEKIYSRAGPEFGDREGSLMIFKKALYGLRSSSRAFRTHFADFLRSMGFSATRYDRDVWMRAREEQDGYDYICTHVDDFKIVAKDPERWKSLISAAFMLKSIGPPSYYLGNDYNFSSDENAWVIGCSTYLDECIRRLEADPELCLNGTIYPHRTPLPEGCHPELDESPLLSEVGIRKYQMLIGMAQWASTIGRLDIAFAVSSLSRFSEAPREGHLELTMHLFGYLKKFRNRRIVLDSRPLIVDPSLRKDSFHPDFLDDYPDAHEDIASNFLKAYGKELVTSVFFDADHAHDHVTRRSITGLIVFVGCTPVVWLSKRQGCIATSTYCAEFISMRSAVEEAISIRYMLRCLGIPVTVPTNLYGDNFGVIQSAEIPDGELKKKHIAISYHYVREAIAARIVNAIWIRSAENFADICTKALGSTIFHALATEMMA